MSKGQIFESIVGVVVLAVAAAFLYYAYETSGRALTARTYTLNAVFGRIDGVTPGSEVRISGVKVGAVADSGLDPKTFEARVSLAVANGVAVPEDSVAKVVSDGLLGGAHISIEPGASDIMLTQGDTISITQGSVDLLGLAMQAFTEGGKSDEPDAEATPAEQSADGDLR
ncbi:MAG: outer membrane lipid asymmetry maintenance protein MlaD [Pseudomonadota bacterium]